jgi:hypothetical protein
VSKESIDQAVEMIETRENAIHAIDNLISKLDPSFSTIKLGVLKRTQHILRNETESLRTAIIERL